MQPAAPGLPPCSWARLLPVTLEPVAAARQHPSLSLLPAAAVLVAWRNRRATLLRLLAPFVFLLLALLIQLALDANSKRYGCGGGSTSGPHAQATGGCPSEQQCSCCKSCSCLHLRHSLSSTTPWSVPCCRQPAPVTDCTCTSPATPRRQERIREADPAPLVPISPLPSCHQDLYIASKPCVNFLYSPNSSSVVQVRGHRAKQRQQQRVGGPHSSSIT